VYHTYSKKHTCIYKYIHAYIGEEAAQKTREAAEYTSQKALETADKARETADKAREAAEYTGQKARETAESTAQKAREAAEYTGQKAREKVEHAENMVYDVATGVYKMAENSVNAVKHAGVWVGFCVCTYLCVYIYIEGVLECYIKWLKIL
jgi:hypothetical protein